MRTNWLNILAIVRREFLERVRKKSFLISTILTPVIFGALMILPAALSIMRHEEVRISVVDRTGWAGPMILESRGAKERSGDPGDRIEEEADRRAEAASEFQLAPPDADLEALKLEVGDGKLDGILLVEPDPEQEIKATFYAQSLSNTQLFGLMTGRLNQARLQQKLQKLGLDPAVADQLRGRVDLQTVKVQKGGKTRKGSILTDLIRPILLAMVIYIMIIMYGVALSNGVLEEKSGKVVEVILSAVRPFELMMGKIVGIASVGLLQYGIWFLLGAGLYLANPMNVASSSEGGWMKPLEMVVLVLYFLFGFVFYASIYAAVGATCTTQQEAQQWQTPVTFGLVIPFVLMMPTLQSPNAGWVVGLSLFPVTSPITMLLRVGAVDVPHWQIAASLVLLALGTLAVAWMAAKIYRVGILMTGKRPTIPEVLRWMREK
ncbi:MAG: ABC transporter permease [Acidobacteriota bacterium]